MNAQAFSNFLNSISKEPHRVLDSIISLNDYVPIDLSSKNTALEQIDVSSSKALEKYIAAYLQKNKLVHGLPELTEIQKLPDYTDVAKPLNNRARAYLDVNCAHCHQKGGSAKTSGMHLNYQEQDNYKLGIGKPPVAAGHGSGNLAFDIVAGKPDESILLYRMKNLDPAIVMPEIGKNVVHKEGVKLIEDWIRSLEQ